MTTGANARLRPSDRRALTIGAIVVGALLTYAWVVRPMRMRIASMRGELLQQRALLVREQALVAAASSMPHTRQRVRISLDSEQVRVFGGDSVAATGALARHVSEIALANGIHVASVEGRSPSTHDGLTTVLADMRGDARWRDALGFVRTLESGGALINVESLRLERGARGGPLGGDLIAISATLSGLAVDKR